NWGDGRASAGCGRRVGGDLAEEKLERGDLVLKRSRERRAANNKSARCALKNTVRQEKKKQKQKKQPSLAGYVFHPVRKQNEYLGYRACVPGIGSTSSMPILIGAAMIAVAILLCTFVTALGTRYVGIEGSSGEPAR